MKRFLVCIIIVLTYSIGNAQYGGVIYVNSFIGNDEWNGSNKKPLKTIRASLAKVEQNGTIYLYGKFVEDGLYTTKTDVRMIGIGTQPREGNTGRPNGPKVGAVDWRYDKGNEPLLHIIHQGWYFENMMLRGSQGGTILINRNIEAETSDSGEAGDHASFNNVTLQGGYVGIEATGGIFGVKITNSFFRMIDKAVWVHSNGVGFPLYWFIKGNRFIDNKVNIEGDLPKSVIVNNYFVP